jgi:hypothetical protein
MGRNVPFSHLPAGVQADRVRVLNDKHTDQGGSYVLYWMQVLCCTKHTRAEYSYHVYVVPGEQSAVRVEYNYALEVAIAMAEHLNRPLLILFVLCESYPGANARYVSLFFFYHHVRIADHSRFCSMVLRQCKQRCIV